MPPRERKEYISVKNCPICGEGPQRITTQLGRPGGHGYPGKNDYQYVCECCRLLKGESHHDIYDSPEDAINRAKKSWNDQVNCVQAYIDRQYVRRKDII